MSRPSDLPPAEKYEHGTRARYVAGCRCDDCKRSNREAYHKRQAEAKELAKRINAPKVPVPQEWTAPDGTKKTRYYQHACPGVDGKPCEWQAHLRKDSKGGCCNRCRMKLGWNGLVDAGEVREHILYLSRLGVGYKTVAEAANVGVTTLADVRAGRKKKIRAQSAKRVLEVGTDAKADKAFVDARPSQKLLKKLLRLGYTKTELASRLGSKAKVPSLQLLERKKMTVRSAHEVKKVYDDIMEEQRIMEEMKKFCEHCGHSHSKENRQRILKTILPATTSVIKELYPCFYDNTDAKVQDLSRDLRAIGAYKEGPKWGEGAWYLPGKRDRFSG